MTDNIWGSNFPKTVNNGLLASANGLETNDVIEDWRNWLDPSLARRHWWDSVYYLRYDAGNHCNCVFSSD